MDLHQNIESSFLRQRRKEATFEQIRSQLTDDLLAVMREKKVTLPRLAELMNFTETETRQRLYSRDLTLSQLVDILDILDLQPRILFHIRKGAIVK